MTKFAISCNDFVLSWAMQKICLDSKECGGQMQICNYFESEMVQKMCGWSPYIVGTYYNSLVTRCSFAEYFLKSCRVNTYEDHLKLDA